MNELTTQQKQAVLPVAERLLDPAYFHQIVMISKVMANSSMIPASLKTVKKGNEEEPLPPEVVEANCFLIANQAMKWRMEPFGVAQACSIVYGRLMFEGKLVAAVLDANLGVKLDYLYGAWDAKKECCDVGKDAVGDNIAVRVIEVVGRAADGSPIHGKRYIDGHVGGWKTTGNNSPWKGGALRKQLAYRGAREWSRVFEPGIMIGVLTDDEVIEHDMRDITPSKTASVMDDIRNANAQRGGFDNARVQEQTKGKEEKADSTKDDQEPANTDEGQSATDGSAAEDAGSPTDQASTAEEQADHKNVPASDENSDLKWLQDVAKMLWAGTNWGKPEGDEPLDYAAILKNQRKAAAASYPTEGVSEKYLKKAASVFDRCMDVVSGAIEPSDGLELIAGMCGLDDKDLAAVRAASRK